MADEKIAARQIDPGDLAALQVASMRVSMMEAEARALRAQLELATDRIVAAAAELNRIKAHLVDDYDCAGGNIDIRDGAITRALKAI